MKRPLLSLFIVGSLLILTACDPQDTGSQASSDGNSPPNNSGAAGGGSTNSSNPSQNNGGAAGKGFLSQGNNTGSFGSELHSGGSSQPPISGVVSIPEPSLVFGLGLLGIGGIVLAARRRSTSPENRDNPKE